MNVSQQPQRAVSVSRLQYGIIDPDYLTSVDWISFNQPSSFCAPSNSMCASVDSRVLLKYRFLRATVTSLSLIKSYGPNSAGKSPLMHLDTWAVCRRQDEAAWGTEKTASAASSDCVLVYVIRLACSQRCSIEGMAQKLAYSVEYVRYKVNNRRNSAKTKFSI